MIWSFRRQLGAWISLAVVALAAAAAWRVEIEYGDVAGQWWVTYTHWAVPGGCLLFVCWATVVPMSLARVSRVTLGLALVAVMFVGLGLADLSLRWLFEPLRTGQPPAGWDMAASAAGAAFLASVPLLVAVVARLARLPVSWRRLIAAEAIWLAAPVLAAAAVPLIMTPDPAEQLYGLDFAHAIKTGLIVPPLVISLGIVFIPRRSHTEKP
jgi:hypothetical protein